MPIAFPTHVTPNVVVFEALQQFEMIVGFLTFTPPKHNVISCKAHLDFEICKGSLSVPGRKAYILPLQSPAFISCQRTTFASHRSSQLPSMLRTAARFLILLCACTFVACNSDLIFDETLEIPNASWSYDNPVSFEFEVTDTTKAYQVMLEVEHTGDFGYQNCYVQITTKFPNGEAKKQPVSLELAAQSGIWNGQCSGNTCTLEIPLQGKAKFKAPGKHSITIEQFMRVNPLSGVESIGLKIKQLE